MDIFERIESAIDRITSGQAPMRIPVDQTDPDTVLRDCQIELTALRARVAKLEETLEILIESGNYLAAEAVDNWIEGRVSVDMRDAALNWRKCVERETSS